MGGGEGWTQVYLEPMLGYHPLHARDLTLIQQDRGQCQVGSLTGAVASEKVTEALKGQLSTDGNRASECKRRSWPNCEDDGPSSNESWS